MKNLYWQIARYLARHAGFGKRLFAAVFPTFILLSPLQAAPLEELYREGLQALSAGQPSRARELFARVIELDSSQPGPWLDFAIAARAEGDLGLADDVLQMLLSRFVIPQHLVPVVERLRAEIDQAMTVARASLDQRWRLRTRLSTAVGSDSNANGGLTINSLALTFPEGSFLFPINPSLKRRADEFFVFNFLFSAQRYWEGGLIEPFLRARTRENFSVRDFNTSEVAAGLIWTIPGESAGAAQGVASFSRVSLTQQNIRLGGRGLLDSTQISAEHQWSGRTCGPAVGLQLDDRSFLAQRNLDSRVFWGLGRWVCESSGGRHSRRLQVQGRVGHERAKEPLDYLSGSGRTGGNTDHIEVGFLYLQAVPSWLGSGRLEAEAVFAQARDSDGYSMLLENNERRSINRSSIGVAYSRPISADSRAFLGLGGELNVLWQAFEQRSNLEIFRTQGRQVSIGATFFW